MTTTNTATILNIRHDIEASVLADAVARRMRALEENGKLQAERAAELTAQYLEHQVQCAATNKSPSWTNPPTSPSKIERWTQEALAEERDYFAKARVIEIAPNRFILVYGDADDSTVTEGTGPFESFEKAQAWFVRLGR